MNKTSKKIGITFAVLWILSIIFFYFFDIKNIINECSTQALWCGESFQLIFRTSHLYYKEAIISSLNTYGIGKINPIFSITGISILLYFLFFLHQKFLKGKKEIDIKLSPFYILIIFSIFFFIVSFNWFSFYDILNENSFYEGIFTNYFSILGQLLFIILATSALGRCIFVIANGMKCSEAISCLVNKKQDFFVRHSGFAMTLFSFGFGAVSIVFILFILGLFGLLTPLNTYIIFTLILIISYKEIWKLVCSFFKRNIVFKSKYLSIKVILIFILFFFLSHNILELIRPMPIGFDDLGLYMNTPKLLFEGETLLSGLDSYSWGLFMSLGYLLFNSTTLTLFLSFLGGVLSLFGLYVLVKKYCEKRDFEKNKQTYALLISTLFYSLPTIVFQSAKDMKVDLAGLFFSILSLLAFFFWLENFKEKKKYKWLFVSAFFIGFAFSIKYTFLLFALSLLIYLIIFLWKEKLNLFKKIKILLLFLIIFSLPFAPFGIKNLLETKQLNIISITKGLPQSPNILFDPPFEIENNDEQNLKIFNSNDGASGELERYIGFENSWEKYIFLPFTTTFNTTETGMYVDIGFIFLALIPLFLIFVIENRTKRDKAISYITERNGIASSLSFLAMTLIAGIVFWILWAVFAKGIIWYGYAGFLFLFLWIVEILEFFKKKKIKIVSSLIFISFSFWFLSSLFLRSAYLPHYSIAIDRVGAKYAKGLLNEEEYFKNKIPTYLPIIEKINADIEQNKNNPPKIFRVGTFIKYFLKDNNKLVLDDNQLDIFNKIYYEKDDKKTLNRLKNSGFKYIIIDTNTPTIDKSPEKVVTKRYLELLDFIKNNPDNFMVITNKPNSRIIVVKMGL